MDGIFWVKHNDGFLQILENHFLHLISVSGVLLLDFELGLLNEHLGVLTQQDEYGKG
jgi:hypothetical protein